MNRCSRVAIISVLAGVSLFLLAPSLFQKAPQVGFPYALWRNGVIVHIRNCAAPKTNATLLQCAGLYCAQKVTKILTNAQQAQLTINTIYKDNDTGHFIVQGGVAQYLNSATLPNSFSCRMQSYRIANPSLTFPKNA